MVFKLRIGLRTDLDICPRFRQENSENQFTSTHSPAGWCRTGIKDNPCTTATYMEKQALLPIRHFEDEESGRFSLYQFAFCVFNGVTGSFRLRRSWPPPCSAKD